MSEIQIVDPTATIGLEDLISIIMLHNTKHDEVWQKLWDVRYDIRHAGSTHELYAAIDELWEYAESYETLDVVGWDYVADCFMRLRHELGVRIYN